ncbi:unnamed protein product [Amoebophrya sp. A25]|nr:unnamed protein product [Amoebophrya sp. A25]|eukprot:GSA25T00001757001.1
MSNVSKALEGLEGEARSRKIQELYPREWAIFRQIDVNSDGYVCESELALMCRQVGIHPMVSRDIARQLFADVLRTKNYRARLQSACKEDIDDGFSGMRRTLSDGLFGDTASPPLASGSPDKIPPRLSSNAAAVLSQGSPQNAREGFTANAPPASASSGNSSSAEAEDAPRDTVIRETFRFLANGTTAHYTTIITENETEDGKEKALPHARSSASSSSLLENEPGVCFEDMLEMFDEIYAVRRMAREKQWKRTIGIGVAGNVAGHMEQAGEADKTPTKQEEQVKTPAAIFAFYLPDGSTQREILETNSTTATRSVLERFGFTVSRRIQTLRDVSPRKTSTDPSLRKARISADSLDTKHPQSPTSFQPDRRTTVDALQDKETDSPRSSKESLASLDRQESTDITHSQNLDDARTREDYDALDALDDDDEEPDIPALVNTAKKSISNLERMLERQELRRGSKSLGEALERLTRFPVTNAVISYPHDGGNVQVEPEVALYCDIWYNTSGDPVYRSSKASPAKKKQRPVTVERLVPRKIAAFNDCSIRQLDGSTKLSEKKNWGHGSKGISLNSFRLQDPDKDFSPEGLAQRLVLVSYVKRGSQIHLYTHPAPARNYLLYYKPLLAWITEQMNFQGDQDKWEDVNELLEASEYPMSCWIALGAGEYTEWGQKNFMRPQDEAVVIVYDEEFFPAGPSEMKIRQLFDDYGHVEVRGLVALHQTFVDESQ